MAACNGVDLPDRERVIGRVTLNGQPVVTGEVTYMPDETRGMSGPSAAGDIGADGNYSLTTNHKGRGGDGAVIGWHKVRIVAREDVEPGEPSRSLIPARYGNFATSGLTAEVKAGDDNIHNFELTSP